MTSTLGDTLKDIKRRLDKIENDHKIENLASSHELKWLNNNIPDYLEKYFSKKEK